MNYFNDWWMLNGEFHMSVQDAVYDCFGYIPASNQVRADFGNMLLMGGELG